MIVLSFVVVNIISRVVSRGFLQSYLNLLEGSLHRLKAFLQPDLKILGNNAQLDKHNSYYVCSVAHF